MPILRNRLTVGIERPTRHQHKLCEIARNTEGCQYRLRVPRGLVNATRRGTYEHPRTVCTSPSVQCRARHAAGRGRVFTYMIVDSETPTSSVIENQVVLAHYHT